MSTDLERPPEEMARRPAGEGWLEMHIWRDIGWAVRCRPFAGSDGLSWEFEGYEVKAFDDGHFEYQRADSDLYPDLTRDIDAAERIFYCSVSWDGCSNWSWDTEEGMWHACRVGDVGRMSQAMERVYQVASVRVSRWEHGLAGTGHLFAASGAVIVGVLALPEETP